MRDDLHELVTEISAEHFFLAGHSMGGKTAISFALKWPEMLQGLAVADISPFRGDDKSGKEHSYHKRILNAMLSLDLTWLIPVKKPSAELQKSGLPPEIQRIHS